MEDYLEAIYNLKSRTDVARVKDIAREMAVKMPSVTGAIHALAEKGLVTHNPYDTVELTDEGFDRARGVAQRHAAIKGFLTAVLGLTGDDAEAEACAIEHSIRPDTLNRLLRFVESARQGHGHSERPRLSQLDAGARGRIALVCGRGHIGKRLLEMGLTPGTPFEVVRHAPLGDPVEIKVRGYLLSLRKSEAEHIEVEL
jgi:DtxR family Mn-dependent transcriptional regulator